MIKYAYLKNRNLSFTDNGTVYFSDPIKEKKLYEYIDYLQRYINLTKLKYLIYATLEDGLPIRSLVMLEKPIVFTSLYNFKMHIIKGSPTSFFYVERQGRR